MVAPPDLPVGSRLLGYQDYLVQDLLIQPCNTRYRLARYRTPDGKQLTAQLPASLQGTHFGLIVGLAVPFGLSYRLRPGSD